MKRFHGDKDDNNEASAQMETVNENGKVPSRMSKHSWHSKNGCDGSKYKKNVTLCSYLR